MNPKITERLNVFNTLDAEIKDRFPQMEEYIKLATRRRTLALEINKLRKREERKKK